MHYVSFQGQAKASNAEIEELKQAVMENKRDLLAIQKAFESENEAAKERLRILENELGESKAELVRTRDELARTKSQLTTLSSKILSKVDSSFMMVCGYQSASWSSLGTVQFDSLASEYNNPGNMLDISTGLFTSYTAGNFIHHLKNMKHLLIDCSLY